VTKEVLSSSALARLQTGCACRPAARGRATPVSTQGNTFGASRELAAQRVGVIQARQAAAKRLVMGKDALILGLRLADQDP
jgi:hypothetical protein